MECLPRFYFADGRLHYDRAQAEKESYGTEEWREAAEQICKDNVFARDSGVKKIVDKLVEYNAKNGKNVQVPPVC